MCVLTFPSSVRREISKPWLVRVSSLLAGRNYWQAARSTKQRLDLYCVYSCVVLCLNVQAEDSQLVDVLSSRLHSHGVLSRRERSRLLWCDAFLACVASHSVDVSTRAEQLRQVIQAVAVITGAFDELEGEL